MNGGTFHYRMYSQFALNLEGMIRETYIQKHAADFKLDADTTVAEYTKAAGMNDKDAARYMKQNGFTPEMKAFDAYGINGKDFPEEKSWKERLPWRKDIFGQVCSRWEDPMVRR